MLCGSVTYIGPRLFDAVRAGELDLPLFPGFNRGEPDSPVGVVSAATPTLRGLVVAPTPVPASPTAPLAAVASPVVPTATATDLPPVPSATLPVVGDWQTVWPGLEEKLYRVKRTVDSPITEDVLAYRLDPARFLFDIGYAPGSPLTLTEWSLTEVDLLLVLNGGYFTEEMIATGLVIADGAPSGSSYGSFAGMVAVGQNSGGGGPSSQIDVRWLNHQPYYAGEPLWAALQAFPMLVHPGGTIGFPADQDSGDRARRTVVGIDQNGYLLFVFATTGSLTLSDMSRFLAESDLNVDRALNLDGGSSTGFVLRAGTYQKEVLPLSRLPTVIRVYAKE